MRRNIIPTLVCCLLAVTLVRAAAPPDVSMLVPGFKVEELPVRLSNINNLRFSPEGKLTALGYDGRIHLLHDTDGDGLEDASTLYWGKRTLSVPVGMVWGKEGLYVSSRGKISLFRDTDGDGAADTEEIVASGWPPTDVGSGGVDATSITMDGSGNLYFGLLTADYSNPYRVRDGVSHYDLKSPRGTIQQWSPATRRMETIATGIRVPYALAFNRAGDLFVTDQEGETWCPGGNPLDELNHIVRGRNYGFPPRHEKYLPDLVSEEPVVGFGPQHQSTCGLVFNEATAAHKSFGPPWWEGDALVAGESRGKLWRVRMVKTPAGYVGRETLFARLSMLTIDMAIAKDGALYVTCHSGPPDWGTGPEGEGRLFKITYVDPASPQPVAVWPAAPMELRVAFDRPIDPAITNGIAGMRIEFGEFVSAADRLEVLKPPYKTVTLQENAPRGTLRVVSASLSSDGRTLALATDPHSQAVPHALTLPGVRAAGSKAAPATIDLEHRLEGVEAQWSGGYDLSSTWTGWLPSLDSDVNMAFTARSAEHDILHGHLGREGLLHLTTQFLPPKGKASFRVQAGVPFELVVGGRRAVARVSPNGEHAAEMAIDPAAGVVPLSLSLKTGPDSPPQFHTTVWTELDPTPRPLALGALLLPWARPHSPEPREEAPRLELAGGDFERGRDLYFSDRLKCSTCHRVRGQGALIGPDLSNLVHQEASAVLRAIVEPNATINPDYVAHHVQLRNGEDLTGFLRAQDTETLRLVGADGKERLFPRGEVESLRTSAVSLMPTGLLDGLSQGQIRDLLTFLTHAPPVRSRGDLERFRDAAPKAAAPEGSDPSRLVKMVLVAGPQDHGPGQHDYPQWQKAWLKLLKPVAGIVIESAWEWPSAEQWAEADVLVFYLWNHNWSPERLRQLDTYQNRGGGVVVLHAATIADKEPEQLALRIGLAAQPGPTKYLHTPLRLNFSKEIQDPIIHGFADLDLLDEPYWPMFGDVARIQVLASAVVEDKPRPLIWTCERGRGRVFASILGHYTWTLEDPVFRLLLLRGIAWTAKQPVVWLDSVE